ncbi:response regulator transcription factor [Kallipyga massiliensis]|uniref:response regulator transcription factor n=1 Tax=Kallipyga massiliensis TaxID=1472764 RepID=UPI0004BA993B|nr:response regulator transcription factor [Kallipyga massiliensis]
MDKILLVEDDGAIVSSLTEYLTEKDFLVVAVGGEREARLRLKEEPFDLLLIDISLQNGTGFGVLEAAKTMGVPGIFLTAQDEEETLVRTFEEGANDYIVKPFRPRELLARIQNVLRREGRGETLQIQDVLVNLDRGTITRQGKEEELSALEYRLLETFLANRGQVLRRSQLLEDIWDLAGDFVNDNTLSVYIKRLREKLEEDPKNPKIITTVRGIGYRMD